MLFSRRHLFYPHSSSSVNVCVCVLFAIISVFSWLKHHPEYRHRCLRLAKKCQWECFSLFRAKSKAISCSSVEHLHVDWVLSSKTRGRTVDIQYLIKHLARSTNKTSSSSYMTRPVDQEWSSSGHWPSSRWQTLIDDGNHFLSFLVPMTLALARLNIFHQRRTTVFISLSCVILLDWITSLLFLSTSSGRWDEEFIFSN